MKDGVYTVFHAMSASNEHELSVLDMSFLDPDSTREGASVILRGLSTKDLENARDWLSNLVDNLQPQIPGS
jgi:hypothetical protein